MQEVAISFHNLGKIYRSGFWGKRHEAVKGLELKVPAGAVFGFLGANGAGKTTSIKILLGLQLPTSGSVSVWGQSINSLATRERIGYLPERPVFHLDLTANEFLNFHRSLFGARTRLNPGKSNQELLELVGIPDVGARLLREFSKGMLQRIGIAQALVNSPDLIILDEPMSGLDPVGRRDVRLLIDQLSREGKTIFFSTHILSDVESLCTELAFLEKGVLKAQGTVEQIINSRKEFSKEITFDGIQEQSVRKHAVLQNSTKFGTGWKLMIQDPQKLQPAIESVWLEKGRLVSLSSPQMSLEAALFPKTQGDGNVL